CGAAVEEGERRGAAHQRQRAGHPRRADVAAVFVAFFFQLRAAGIRVAPTEWLTLLQAVVRGFDRANLTTFYHLARALLVKRETQYDAFDQAFLAVFHGVEGAI